jgi:hypothetical protein
VKQSLLMAEIIHAKSGIVILPHALPPAAADHCKDVPPPADVVREYAPSLVRLMLKSLPKMAANPASSHTAAKVATPRAVDGNNVHQHQAPRGTRPRKPMEPTVALLNTTFSEDHEMRTRAAEFEETMRREEGGGVVSGDSPFIRDPVLLANIQALIRERSVSAGLYPTDTPGMPTPLVDSLNAVPKLT